METLKYFQKMNKVISEQNKNQSQLFKRIYGWIISKRKRAKSSLKFNLLHLIEFSMQLFYDYNLCLINKKFINARYKLAFVLLLPQFYSFCEIFQT